jgi:signal transduction histidine kinase
MRTLKLSRHNSIIRWSLATKLTLAYSILILIIYSVLAVSIFVQTFNQQREITSARLRDILNFSLPSVSGTYHSLITSVEDESKGPYRILASKLQSVAATTDIIRRIYTIRQTRDGKFVYVMDANDDPRIHKNVGDLYQPSTNLLVAGLNDLKNLTSATVEETVSKESTGLYLRGFVPIVDELHRVDGALVIEIDASSITASQIQSAQVSILAFVATAPLALILGWWLSQRIIEPINELMAGTKRMAQGQLNQPVQVRSRDELGVLGAAFNEMSAELAQFYATLEKRVQERTVELEQARKEAEIASNAKSVFLSNVSHELRAPLNMVIGYTSAMIDMPRMYKNEVLPEIYRNDISIIRANGEYLLGLLNDILDLSKIESGKLELELGPVNLTEILKGVLATSLGLVKDKPIQIRLQHPENMPLIWGDILRIQQILLNLMSNAIKFTESGRVTLLARLEGDQVRISVSDTGIGIPKDSLEVIFDRYQQVQSNVNIQGTGLGLEICQRLAQLHGTRITVESVLGQGSTFEFTLSIANPEQLEHRREPANLVDGTIVRFFEKKPQDTQVLAITALLITDHTETRTALHQIFESLGHVLIDVTDFIIIDSAFHKQTSTGVISLLQSNAETNEIPIVAIVDTNDGYPSGIMARLHKPLTPDHIQIMLETLPIATNSQG